MNNRAEALFWWKSLTKDQQNDLAKQFHPDSPTVLITTSSSKIEAIWEGIEGGKNV